MPLYPVQKAIGGQQALLDEYLPNAERNVFGGKVTLRDMLDFVRGKTAEEQVAGFAGPAINPALPLAVGQIKGLYHGSPYKFSKFANEKIGTGEGAQAFGYGHYLSESPEIASSYGESVSNMKATNLFRDIPISKLPYDQGSVVSNILMKQQKGQSFNEAKQSLMDYLQKSNQTDKFDFLNSLNEQDFKIIKNKYLYETTVNKGKPSSADVFLEWDKPLSQQPKIVKKLKDKIPEDEFGMPFEQMTGARVIAAIESTLKNPPDYAQGSKEVSDFLSNLGITGIKYQSGTLSGIKNSPYYNYVIFNPEDITIEAVK